MSILSDSAIIKGRVDQQIIITPYDAKQLGSNSYDVLLDSKLIVYRDNILDCKKDHEIDSIEIPEEGFELQPGQLYLGSTVEYTETKNHVIMFEGKSSLARLGLLVHITSGFGDVGYKGHITVELACIQPVRIYPNMKIGQIYYQTVEGFVINSYDRKKDAKYNNNTPEPIKSLMFKNWEEDDKFKQRIRDSGISFDPDKITE